MQDKLLISRTSQELEVDISDVNVSTLSKAFKLAAKTRLKVGSDLLSNKKHQLFMNKLSL